MNKKFIFSVLLLCVFTFSFYYYLSVAKEERKAVVVKALVEINEAKHSFSLIEKKLYGDNFYTALVGVFENKTNEEIQSELKSDMSFLTENCLITFHFNPNKIICELSSYSNQYITLTQDKDKNAWECSLSENNLSNNCS